jgi:hypothetical protein
VLRAPSPPNTVYKARGEAHTLAHLTVQSPVTRKKHPRRQNASSFFVITLINMRIIGA